MEANTVRLLSRLSAFRGDPLAREGQTWLWSLAAKLVPTKEPGLFNQALMELGAGLHAAQSEVRRLPRGSALPDARTRPPRGNPTAQKEADVRRRSRRGASYPSGRSKISAGAIRRRSSLGRALGLPTV
ncbi:MAG: hypothetical protein QM775_18870 [Pirellulales bacterium]